MRKWLAPAVCVVVVLVAILAPWIAPYDPNAVDPLDAYAPFSAAHPLGTDDLGRDLLSRLMYGARTSLTGPLFVVLAAGAAGTTRRAPSSSRSRHEVRSVCS